ncbi:hypothetical protein BN406_03780 (plasmid) [Sinorhizobium meliloti Rm41]|nr:hypothetical protein BN406_03780 [Sinorhizobium meliloti Rm41]
MKTLWSRVPPALQLLQVFRAATDRQMRRSPDGGSSSNQQSLSLVDKGHVSSGTASAFSVWGGQALPRGATIRRRNKSGALATIDSKALLAFISEVVIVGRRRAFGKGDACAQANKTSAAERSASRVFWINIPWASPSKLT